MNKSWMNIANWALNLKHEIHAYHLSWANIALWMSNEHEQMRFMFYPHEMQINDTLMHNVTLNHACNYNSK